MSNYRQSTAEALGLTVYIMQGDKIEYADEDGRKIDWQPDKDANHRDMVWEYMKEQRKLYILDRLFRDWLMVNGESLFTATEKAWEEYTNNK